MTPDLPLPGRWVALVAGSALLAVGVTMLLAADLGADAYTAFLDGIAQRTGAPFGTVVFAVGSAAVLLSWLTGRSPLGPGALVQPLLTGQVINATIDLFDTPAGLAARAGLCAAGVLAAGCGIGLYLHSALGRGPQEAVVAVIEPDPSRFARTFNALQVLLLVAAWALGGAVGAGSVLAGFAVGPVATISLRTISATAANRTCA